MFAESVNMDMMLQSLNSMVNYSDFGLQQDRI